jgi:hypothetical protein
LRLECSFLKSLTGIPQSFTLDSRQTVAHRTICQNYSLEIASLPCALGVPSRVLVGQFHAELPHGLSSCSRHFMIEIRRAEKSRQSVLPEFGREISSTALNRSIGRGCELPVGASSHRVGDAHQVGEGIRMPDLFRFGWPRQGNIQLVREQIVHYHKDQVIALVSDSPFVLICQPQRVWGLSYEVKGSTASGDKPEPRWRWIYVHGAFQIFVPGSKAHPLLCSKLRSALRNWPP